MKDWRYTTTRGCQLESVSPVCGRTTYFALGQSRQSRPGAGKFPCGVPAPGPLVPKFAPGSGPSQGDTTRIAFGSALTALFSTVALCAQLKIRPVLRFEMSC